MLEPEQEARLERAQSLAAGRSGWLTPLDAQILFLLLTEQQQICTARGILEVGVYAGKSATLLAAAAEIGEHLHLCDPMESTPHTGFADDVPALADTSAWLAAQYDGVPVTPVPCRSSELPAVLGRTPSLFRAVHIDGDHAAHAVAIDLEYAADTTASDGGIVVVDDFRSPHTPGVAAAFWPWLSGLAAAFAVVLTEYKAYVLLGRAWESVTQALPPHLDDAYLAGTEDLLQMPSFRYAPSAGSTAGWEWSGRNV
jgi:hypothetical protein